MKRLLVLVLLAPISLAAALRTNQIGDFTADYRTTHCPRFVDPDPPGAFQLSIETNRTFTAWIDSAPAATGIVTRAGGFKFTTEDLTTWKGRVTPRGILLGTWTPPRGYCRGKFHSRDPLYR